jgi:hypothetical protein
MDHSPFEGIFKTLLPIAIFILWAMVSRPAKKKKKEQEALARRRQREIESAPSEPTSSSGHIPEPEPVEGDWKQSIDDVLEEMGLPVERKPLPPSPSPVEKSAEKVVPPKEPIEEQSLEDLEPEIVPKKAVDEKMKSHLAIQEAAYILGESPIDNQKVYVTPAESSLSENASRSFSETSDKSPGPGDLKKFIVWSEVLSKPVSLRDEEYSRRP